MSKKNLTFIFSIFLLISLVFSIEFVYYDISLDLDSEKNITEFVEMKVKNNEEKEIYSVNYTATTNIILTETLVDGKRAQSKLHDFSTHKEIEIIFPTPLQVNKSLIVLISFLTEGYIHKYDDRFQFSIGLSFPQKIDFFKLTVTLPEGSVLPISDMKKTDSHLVLYPPGEITSDGRSLVLSWSKEKVESGDSQHYFVVYEFVQPRVTVLVKEVTVEKIVPQVTVKTEYVEKESKNVYWVSLAQGGLLILLLYYLFTRKPKTRDEVSQVILKSVDADEELALSQLMETTDPITQRELQDMCQFSKAKLCRVLARLENKGFISRTKYGRTNKIRLTKKIEGDLENQISG